MFQGWPQCGQCLGDSLRVVRDVCFDCFVACCENKPQPPVLLQSSWQAAVRVLAAGLRGAAVQAAFALLPGLPGQPYGRLKCVGMAIFLRAKQDQWGALKEPAVKLPSYDTREYLIQGNT